MKFFKFSDLAKSWSVWAASAVAVTPVVDMSTGLFSFIPEQYKPLAVTALGFLTVVLRSIKQTHTIFSTSENKVTKAVDEILDSTEEDVKRHKAQVDRTVEQVEQVVSVAKKVRDLAKSVK